MIDQSFDKATFDSRSPYSIYNYSRFIIGKSLRGLLGDDVVLKVRKGKGGLGQMVEELFFKYDINSCREADFRDANLELKCTPLLKSKSDGAYRIKERLVCTMIDYQDIVNTPFEESHLISKCKLMLLLFYEHISGVAYYDLEFLFRVLWELPEKDLLLIKKDYDTIAEKVRRGEAHNISEGDTLYLGACRKGQKGDSLQKQPFSDVGAVRRAFSLKPSYMRFILQQVQNTGGNAFSNYSKAGSDDFELVSSSDLRDRSFEEIILSRFTDFYGLNYIQICDKLGIVPYQAKNKYADVSALIASNGVSKRLSNSDEFLKSGIIMKTVRLGENGMPKESTSFKNIDYHEVYNNDDWYESELYEIFTSRFMFVVFKPEKGEYIEVKNKDGQSVREQSYVLDKVMFWTMPPADLDHAREYWEHIRSNVKSNNIRLDAFWSAGMHRRFHVRPKAVNKTQMAPNPNGGVCGKYCYWFNREYVKSIIDNL